MQTQNEQLDSEIIPALFEVLPEAFPEFGFTKTSKGYKSTTNWKVTHERGDSSSAVSVTEEHPYYFKDWTRGGKAIYTYVKEREGLDKHRDVVRKLAELAGITYREQQLTPEEEERFRWINKQADLWEATNDFFIECLSLESNQYATTSRAKQVRDYLSNPLDKGGRGYSPGLFRLSGQMQDRQRPRMELGYIPDVFALRDYLTGREFDYADVTPFIRGLTEMPDSRIGKDNVLTFPYRDHIGQIKGMVFRSLLKNDPLKYLYSPGLKRGSILFNLSSVARSSDLVIVEAPLDALHASALGIKNITALGGSGDTLNKAQVDLAIRYGAGKITLMLDNDSTDGIDHAGAKGTDKAVTFLQKEYPALKVYVGQYPDGIKDLDELLNKQGEEGFYQVKDSALAAWRYQLYRLLAHYSSLGDLVDKQLDNLNQDVVELGSKLSRLDNDGLIREYTSNPVINELGVTEEGIKEITEQIRRSNQKKKQQESFQNLLREAKSANESDGISMALDLLQKEARDIRAQDKADVFSGLSATITEDELKIRVKSRPEPLESGFELDGEPLLIPAAAISMFAAATSHGKSIMLANLILNLAELYPKKTFHLFSYEVDEEQYLINLLNPFIGDNELSSGSNRDSIHAYLGGKTEITRRDLRDRSRKITLSLWKNSEKEEVFNRKKAEFFSELTATGRIKVHYVTHDSDTLIDAIRHLNKTEPLGAVLIDYIQLINLPIGRLPRASRQEQVKQMCQDFKDLFNETGLPLIFAAQFNRNIQGPFDMHPTNLGEAGDLERIASLVLAIWNNSQKWTLPTGKALDKLKDKIPFVFDQKSGEEVPNPKTWYVEAIKRRTGRVGTWDIWDYLPNAGKVVSGK